MYVYVCVHMYILHILYIIYIYTHYDKYEYCICNKQIPKGLYIMYGNKTLGHIGTTWDLATKMN